MKTKKTLKETVVEGIYREIEEGIYKPNDIIHEKYTKGGLSGGSCDPEGDTGSSGIQN